MERHQGLRAQALGSGSAVTFLGVDCQPDSLVCYHPEGGTERGGFLIPRVVSGGAGTGPGSVWPGTRGVYCTCRAFGRGRAPESWAARREKTDVVSSEDDAPDSPVILEAPSLPPLPPAYTAAYKKSLRLSSDQIVSLCTGVFVCRRVGGGVVITVREP